MSAAFDTIDRDILLQILKNIVEEDELRLIQFLLSNTHINTRINNADINAPFTSNVGTPQGDGLSPVLFTIYLEHALKEVRTVKGEPKSPLEEKIPREIGYADDVDFVDLEYIDIDAVQRTLHRYNLKFNIDKTEKKNIIKQNRGCLEINEEGWLADGWQRRRGEKKTAIERCLIHVYKLKNIWIEKDKINDNIKIKLYKALVKSILTYNCGTWALAQTELNKLDAFHREQLRKVLNIYYPTKISNKTLYKKCNEKPISTHILESHWRLFGHILRRNEEIPANKSMQLYFHRTEKDSGEDQLQPCQWSSTKTCHKSKTTYHWNQPTIWNTFDHWHRTVINGSHSPSKLWKLLRRPDLTTRTRKANSQ